MWHFSFSIIKQTVVVSQTKAFSIQTLLTPLFAYTKFNFKLLHLPFMWDNKYAWVGMLEKNVLLPSIFAIRGILWEYKRKISNFCNLLSICLPTILNEGNTRSNLTHFCVFFYSFFMCTYVET